MVASAFVCAAVFSDGERLQDTTVPLFQPQSVHLLRMAGSKPEQAFFVKCDRTMVTQLDVDEGRLVALVGVAMVRPAEFVIFRVGQ